MRRRSWLGAVAGLVLAGCEEPPHDAPNEVVRQRLTGTWLRDFKEDKTHVRRVLALAPDGGFIEDVRIVAHDGAITTHVHAGSWLFDGTNLKRKYASIDGVPPSAPTQPYAAFEVKFVSKNEFVGIDNVRKREVRYHRVAAGTLP